MGSTSNALDKGGEQLQKTYTTIQTLQKEIEMDKHLLDSIALFIPMEWNYEGFMILMDLPVFVRPKIQSKESDGYDNYNRSYRTLGKRS